MGGGFSRKKKKTFEAIEDKYERIEEVQSALKEAGLQSSNLILGLDYTESNHYTGINTFDGRCLHDISPDRLNPYQSVITIVGRTLEPFDDDKMIPCYGFGDSTTRDRGVFKFYEDKDCYRFTEVLQRYNEVTPTLTLSGPTNFAPLIHQAVEIVKKEGTYHILVIIADGQVVNKKETTQAIVAACEYPLSIIMVGVGDGPWDMMREFDDGLPKRKFDNFQFVNYHEVTANVRYPEPAFAIAALQEIPDQFKEIVKLKLVEPQPLSSVPTKTTKSIRKESIAEELARTESVHPKVTPVPSQNPSDDEDGDDDDGKDAVVVSDETEKPPSNDTTGNGETSKAEGGDVPEAKGTGEEGASGDKAVEQPQSEQQDSSANGNTAPAAVPVAAAS